MTQDSELIEKALEPVRQLLLQKSQASTQEQGKEHQYPIDEKVIKEIQENIVDKVDRFNTWEDFVKEAIKNTVNFWTAPAKMMEMAVELWPDFTSEMKGEIKKNAPEFYYQMEQATKKHNEIAEMIQHISDVKASLSKEEFSVPKNIILGDAYSLMHQSYNRFFPLKILVTTLALMIKENMIKENKTRWIKYITFSEKAFDTALEFSNSLKKITPEGQIAKRNIRISTGLPISHKLNIKNDIMPDWLEKIDKDEKSKQRFFDCYVGPKTQAFQRVIKTAEQKNFSSEVFSGALNETGLVHIQDIEGHLEITLSKLGFEFFALGNPLIDGIIIDPKTSKVIYDLDKKTDSATRTFSNKEIDFIEKKIIPRFKLEKIIVEDVLASMKNKSEVDAVHLDKVIKKTIKKWVVENKTKAVDENIMTVKEGNIVFDEDKVRSYRIATMGRLSEIGKVNWEIRPKILEDGKKGNAESFYSINK